MARNILIVASGPSAAEFDFSQVPESTCIIAVNGAIDWLPRADFWFTLDPSPENMRRMMNQRDAHYVCAGDGILPEGVTRLQRISQQVDQPQDLYSPEWWFWRWSCKAGLSEDGAAIHTGNSAYGALGMAYHMRPAKIVLAGVDGTKDERIGGGYCRDLRHLPMLFASAIAQLEAAGIEIANAGRLDCFQKKTPQECIDWLT